MAEGRSTASARWRSLAGKLDRAERANARLAPQPEPELVRPADADCIY